MKNFSVVALMLGLGLAACGSKAPATSTAAKPVMHDDHGNMPVEITKFHDVLAPVWHDDKNPERMANTCGAVPKFEESTAALVASPVPAGGDKDKWAAAGPTLTAALADLKAKCDAKDAANFEASFAAMHTAFHGFMEASGAMKEHKEGEHKHQGGEHGAH
ncbi:MAG TPA: hypothetical protein PLF40_21735 [Kofleriaceae bacterium]|nr:hypothetical protein [Kofleriaceae bacterium]